jgi:hypothetical protein
MGTLILWGEPTSSFKVYTDTLDLITTSFQKTDGWLVPDWLAKKRLYV